VLFRSVGSAHDAAALSGVTVIKPEDRVVCAVDVRGGGPGTRETEALAPENLVDAVDAIVLAGGSVYGLAAADGVTAALGARGEGFALMDTPGVPRSPVVPAAILYDLANGGDKAWGEEPPYHALGRAALDAAGRDFAVGRAGAGYGARAGATAGGLGSASVVTEDGLTVGALAAVNCFGSVRIPGQDVFWAWPFEQSWNGAPEFGGVRPSATSGPLDADDWGAAKLNPSQFVAAEDTPGPSASGRTNTTIAVIATDVALTPVQAKRVAVMAQDGLARAIRPVHAPFDGDVVFALSTAAQPLKDPEALTIARLGALAADALARAVARGVWEAEKAAAADAAAD